MNLPQIRIVLVDDHELVRGSWKLLLKQDNRFSIIGECRNGAEAIEEAQKLAPDIMIIDINMYPMNGMEATERINQVAPTVKIIGLSINNQPAYVQKMLKAGAMGYMTKNSSLHEMAHAIMEVHNGRQYICEEIRNKMAIE
ncbi:MAG: response regulator transcription factor [Bacteroidetes bacterium]|nr:response regulator transcription factor [Bacteroidota bacterium]